MARPAARKLENPVHRGLPCRVGVVDRLPTFLPTLAMRVTGRAENWSEKVGLLKT